MRLNQIALPVLALLLGATGALVGTTRGVAQGPPPGYGQERGDWNSPPNEFNDTQRRGFQDGQDGARKDFENHRRPDVNNRDEYRHPPVSGNLRDAYREGFEHGYKRAMSHLMGEPESRSRGEWNTPPNEFNDTQRRGFQDGQDGARKDFENHRRPDVNNRDEYRHPSVPGYLRDAYREGFERGYNRAMAHLMGQPWQY
jgi:hypothetical protein